MDLLEGESLRRRLRRDYRVEESAALWITRQTAEALAALHRAGFVHGDVKPDNIRLVNDGTAILIDLGFAHRPGENDKLRARGYILGTVNYLAPELCHSEGQSAYAADIFSLGITLYEMLAGRLPYPGGSLLETMRRHASDPPVDFRKVAPHVSTPLAGLVDKLLERQPERRPRAVAVVQQLVGLEIHTMGRRKSA
jgi:serine/threonine protein kinase